MDEMALLNEILNSSSLEEGDFSQEWRAVFGEEDSAGGASKAGHVETPSEQSSCFLPSQLLDQNMNSLHSPFSSEMFFTSHLLTLNVISFSPGSLLP